MLTTVEAEVDQAGAIRPTEAIVLPPGSRLLITVLEGTVSETALLSQDALAADWQRPEEDEAWSHFSQER